MADIILNNITKTYNKGQIKAIKNVSFTVDKSELFGLVGADGAGKTSLFRILTTLLLPDSGSASVQGLDTLKNYAAIRNHIGYMPSKFSLYQDLTVEENLTFFATLFNIKLSENYDLIKDIYVHIEPFKKRRAADLSGGMKQKLALCCALVHRPMVLFLDEPTTGVDTVSRKEFWATLKNLKQQGITILVSTPYMDEAARCERIALMHEGEILSIDTPANIIQKYPENLFAIKADSMRTLLHDLRCSNFIKTCHTVGEYHHVSLVDQNDFSIDTLTQQIENMNHTHVVVKSVTPTVEDCFIKLITTENEKSSHHNR